MFVKSQNQYGLMPGAVAASRSLWTAVLAISISMAVVVGTSLWGLSALAVFPAIAAGLLLLKYPEIALGALMLIGSFKGAPQLAKVPIDLTVLLLLVLGPAIAYRVWSRSIVSLPWELSLYLPIVLMMILSLTYTPNLAGGLDKTARFIIINGVSILAPFVLLDSPAKIKRFFLTLLVACIGVSWLALDGLGGSKRLATLSGDTIALGHDAALGILIIWFGLLPRQKVLKRLFLYTVMGLLGVAMIGSGSRGPFIGLVLCVLFSVWFRRRVGFGSGQLTFDFGVLTAAAIVLLSVVPIPQASFKYLAQLTNVHSTRAFLGGRAELMLVGLRMTMEHPILGVGIDGFPHVWTDVGNWPHSIPVEFSSELGLGAALVFCVLEVLALRTGVKEFLVATEEWRTAANLVMCFLILEAISMLNTGSINDNRQLWTSLSLPFVLRQVRSTGWYSRYAR
jgi:O-Antigen ligase